MLKIELNRGDTVTQKITITDSDGNIITPDEIYFTVKKTTRNEDYIFQKTLSNGDFTLDEDDNSYSFDITPEDTDNLVYRDYAFDIEVLMSNPEVKKTFLGVLSIKEEVTWAVNES